MTVMYVVVTAVGIMQLSGIIVTSKGKRGSLRGLVLNTGSRNSDCLNNHIKILARRQDNMLQVPCE